MNDLGLPEFPGPWNYSISPAKIVHFPPLRAAPEWEYIVIFCVLTLILVVGFGFLIRMALTAIFGGTGLFVSQALNIVFAPILEELGFRLMLVWFLLHELLETGLLAAFWWSFFFFVAAHVIDWVLDGDLLRIIDAINIAGINTYIFLYGVLVENVDILFAWMAVTLAHIMYNFIIIVLRSIPGLTWLLFIARLAGLFTSIACYWAGMHLLQPYWPWIT